jgi:hypothetical protein
MKRAKKVKLRWQEVITYAYSYQCPECFIIYCGEGPSRNATRFICNCGQELIVDKEIK